MTIRAGRDSRKSKMRFPASCTKQRLAGADANWSNGTSLNLEDELILRLVIAGREVQFSYHAPPPTPRSSESTGVPAHFATASLVIVGKNAVEALC